VVACGTLLRAHATRHSDRDQHHTGFTLLGWAASPLAGLAAGFAVSLLVHRLVLGTRSPAAAAAKRQPLLLALIASLSFLFLLLKGPVFLRRRVAGRPLLALGAALAGGAAVAAGRSTVQWAEKRLRRWAARRARRGGEEKGGGRGRRGQDAAAQRARAVRGRGGRRARPSERVNNIEQCRPAAPSCNGEECRGVGGGEEPCGGRVELRD